MSTEPVSIARPRRVPGASSSPRAAALARARRAAGQTAALASMIAGGRPFEDVALQVLAARGSLDALLLRLLEQELDGCLPADAREDVERLVNAALGRRVVPRPASGQALAPASSNAVAALGPYRSEETRGPGDRLRAATPPAPGRIVTP